MRLSRTCYDKPHRCPGWAGGGPHYASATRCENGSIRIAPRGTTPAALVAASSRDEMHEATWHPSEKPFRFGRCTVCDVVTWPVATRRLDPTHWRSVARWQMTRLRWALEDRGLVRKKVVKDA